MKMKKSIYYFFAFTILGAISVSSCSEDFLTIESEGSFLTSSYYQDESQAYSGLVAVYDVMRKNSGGFENIMTFMNAGSDDFYAGGGGATDGAGIQSFSNYSISTATIPASYWNDHYQGIYRANILLTKLPGVPMDDAKKARFAAEAKALRAYYYFNLVRMFNKIPLVLELLDQNSAGTVTQANPEDVYAQIEADLTEALESLPATLPATEKARFSKGAAQALLGKVYLYDGKNALAAATLAEVNGTPGGTSQYGYHLLPVFADLWVVSNKFNSESILEVSHTNQSNAGWGNWGTGSDEGNSMNQMVGPRSYSTTGGAPSYNSGWSFNPVTESLYNAMLGDPRFNATIADIKALVTAGTATYAGGYQDTGYFLKKFMPLTTDISTSGGEGALNFQQNTYAIRLADTYLLEAEALGGTGARAQALLDAVRARVGLGSVPVTLTAIWAERRLELAGEGHRWYDLVRTGQAATVLASRGFVAPKNNVLPIPLAEFTNTLMVQNPFY